MLRPSLLEIVKICIKKSSLFFSAGFGIQPTNPTFRTRILYGRSNSQVSFISNFKLISSDIKRNMHGKKGKKERKKETPPTHNDVEDIIKWPIKGWR